jgi:hypothetical protein
MTLEQKKLNERLHRKFLQRLRNNHLEEYPNFKTLPDEESIKFRKIYEQHQQTLVQVGLIPGWN